MLGIFEKKTANKIAYDFASLKTLVTSLDCRIEKFEIFELRAIGCKNDANY